MKGDTPLRLGDYEIHRAWEGFSSIRQISSGEIMHSRTDPIREARELYVEQARLAQRLSKSQPKEPLVIWDVGLGAAANATAAIECYEKTPAPRPLKIVSFENDLDSLRLALANPASFPYLRLEAAAGIATKGHWTSADHPGLAWHLLLGDFLETMNRAPAPDLIFFDMFSTKTSARLWAADTFRKIFQACVGRDVELFTYTCSTANRAALLAAGFFVARGRNAGEKIETTIALTPAAEKRDLLSADWLAKWERSAAKFPSDVRPDERPAFEKIIRGHEQFRNSASPKRLPSTT
ncbi:MAG TPA: MnmC family methyltransferase [Chthoniobacterales bacterium]|nr:MnmC family methyltransferase [Chthoniobacterales bacterium]